MARRHIIVTTPPCWTIAPICCSLESDEPATAGRAETRPEEVKRHWRGGDSGCGLYTADISIWQGSLWLLCKPQPRKSTRQGGHPYLFLLLPLRRSPLSRSLLFLLQTSFRLSFCPAWPPVNLLFLSLYRCVCRLPVSYFCLLLSLF